jgi:hypothetical protein
MSPGTIRNRGWCIGGTRITRTMWIRIHSLDREKNVDSCQLKFNSVESVILPPLEFRFSNRGIIHRTDYMKTGKIGSDRSWSIPDGSHWTILVILTSHRIGSHLGSVWFPWLWLRIFVVGGLNLKGE